MTLWRVWFVRNELVHNKPAPPIEVSARFLQSYWESIVVSKRDSGERNGRGKQPLVADSGRRDSSKPSPATLKWSPPPLGRVKLNVAGTLGDGGEAGAGMILRSVEGNIIFSSCRRLYSCREILEAVLYACKEGLEIAMQRSTLPIQVEVNSATAAMLLKSEVDDRSRFAFLVRDVKKLLRSNNSCITHVSNTQNLASISLANFARAGSRTMTWVGSGPPEVLQAAAIDCNDTIIE